MGHKHLTGEQRFTIEWLLQRPMSLKEDEDQAKLPEVSRLISKADKIKLLKAYCFHCHKDAKFSLRIVQSNETVLIGAGEAYKPACRDCHVFFSKEREKGNLNINQLENKENNENKENTPLKLKLEKEFSSSSAETTPSPNKEVN